MWAIATVLAPTPSISPPLSHHVREVTIERLAPIVNKVAAVSSAAVGKTPGLRERQEVADQRDGAGHDEDEERCRGGAQRRWLPAGAVPRFA